MPEAASSVRQRGAAKAASKEDKVREAIGQAEEQYDAKAKSSGQVASKVPGTHHSCANLQNGTGSVWTPTASRLFTAISVITILTRLYKINEPAEVVFDEVHFGGFASNYLRREYFFDVHPPLGKLLIAGMGYFLGYEGNFTFASIGLPYAGSTAPYVAMRCMMVFFGWATLACSFMSMLELGFSTVAAGFAASLLVFDMAFALQTRFILLDSPLMAFISASLYSWIRFRKLRSQPFTVDWWTWLLATGAAIGAATSVKMVGLFTVGTVGIATVVDLWGLADKKKGLSERLVMKHFFARAAALIALPLAIYCTCFYVHFAILNRTGPGDALMSPAFQATLIGNQMHEQSREVKMGQTIRLKSRLEDIFLHSHAHNYPQQHLDGKISSAGQQVTGYPSEDPNNLWQILPVTWTDQAILKQQPGVKNGDLVRLLHVKSNKFLYTHDVASPLTRTNMEVTACNPEEEEKMAAAIWKVEIVTGGDVLKTKSCHIRLLQTVHNVALTNWQQPLPAWGFGQREMNACRRGADENSKWSVWDIVEPMSDEEAKLKSSSKLPTMSTFKKYVELQKAIFRLNAKLIDNHPFKSDPASWPFVLRGISFWDKGKDARIYMLGNIFAWYTALFGVCCFAGLAIKELYRERRGAYTAAESKDGFRQQFVWRAGFIFMAWGLHYLPFFTMARTLYLHHYLPSYVMSTMLAGSVLDYVLHQVRSKRARMGIYVGLVAFVGLLAWTYVYFAPIVYGSFMKSADMAPKKWISTWDWTA